MLGTILGAAIAAFTGLGFLATKHPRLFRERLCNPLCWLCLVAVLLTVIWFTGNWTAHHTLIPLLAAEKQAEAAAIADARNFLYLWIIFGCNALLFYTMGLSWLAGHILNESESAEAEKEGRRRSAAGNGSTPGESPGADS